MALVKRGSRLTAVDGARYRWRVQRRPTYCQANGWMPLTFAIEHAEQPGSVLVVTLPFAHPGNWFGLPTTVVRPVTVATSVRMAIRNGWRPTETGPAFALMLTEDHIAPDPIPAVAPVT